MSANATDSSGTLSVTKDDETSNSKDRDDKGNQDTFTFAELMTRYGGESSGSEGSLQEADHERLSAFYSSLKSCNRVCGSLVSLYEKKKRKGSRKSKHKNIDNKYMWKLLFDYVALLLVKHTNEYIEEATKKTFSLILVHKNSGFELWKKQLTDNCSYETSNMFFHTLSIPINDSKSSTFGIAFHDSKKADSFAKEVFLEINELQKYNALSLKQRKRQAKDFGKKMTSLYRSLSSSTNHGKQECSQISQPCMFNHLSSLTLDEVRTFSSLVMDDVTAEPISDRERPLPELPTSDKQQNDENGNDDQPEYDQLAHGVTTSANTNTAKAMMF